MFVCLSIVSISISISVYFTCRSILSVYFVSLSVCLFCLSVCIVCQSVFCVDLFVCLSICLFVCLWNKYWKLFKSVSLILKLFSTWSRVFMKLRSKTFTLSLSQNLFSFSFWDVWNVFLALCSLKRKLIVPEFPTKDDLKMMIFHHTWRATHLNTHLETFHFWGRKVFSSIYLHISITQ